MPSSALSPPCWLLSYHLLPFAPLPPRNHTHIGLMKAYCHKTFPVRICWMEVFATYIISPVPSIGDSLFLSLPNPLLCTPPCSSLATCSPPVMWPHLISLALCPSSPGCCLSLLISLLHSSYAFNTPRPLLMTDMFVSNYD